MSQVTYAEAEEQVQQPGKFEGEQPWVVLAFDDSMNGCWEIGFPGEEYMEVTADDRREWGLDADTVAVVLYETEQGFVHGEELTASEYESYLRQLEDRAEEEDEEVDLSWPVTGY